MKRLGLGIVLAIGVVLTAWWVGRDSNPRAALHAVAVRATQGRDVDAPTDAVARIAVVETTPRVTTESASSADAESNSAAPIRVRGQVFDLLGSPRAGARVIDVAHASRVVAESRNDGSFEVNLRPPVCLEARADGMVSVLRRWVHDASIERADLVIAPFVDLRGIAVDASGAPVASAHLWLRVDPKAFVGIAVVLGDSTVVERFTMTDAEGQFELKEVPSAPGLTIEAFDTKLGSASVAVPMQSTDPLVIRFPSEVTRAIRVFGRVSTYDFKPAPDCEVRLGENNTTRSDAAGNYELVVRFDFEDADLIAFRPGWLPAFEPRFGRSLLKGRSNEVRQNLYLGAEGFAISGRVEDADGQPLSGWRVSLASGMAITGHRLPPLLVEDFVADGANNQVTDETGRFVLRGLRDDDYWVRAWNSSTCVLLESDRVHAGTGDLRLRVPKDPTWVTVRGVAMSQTREPVSGLHVNFVVRLGYSTGGELQRGPASTTTDAAGRFELRDVPRDHVYLAWDGDDVVEEIFELKRDCDPQSIELSIARKIAARLSVASEIARAADAVQFLDGEERPVFIQLPGGFGGTELPLDSATSSVITISERARSIVLFRAGKEVKRFEFRRQYVGVQQIEL